MSMALCHTGRNLKGGASESVEGASVSLKQAASGPSQRASEVEVAPPGPGYRPGRRYHGTPGRGCPLAACRLGAGGFKLATATASGSAPTMAPLHAAIAACCWQSPGPSCLRPAPGSGGRGSGARRRRWGGPLPAPARGPRIPGVGLGAGPEPSSGHMPLANCAPKPPAGAHWPARAGALRVTATGSGRYAPGPTFQLTSDLKPGQPRVWPSAVSGCQWSWRRTPRSVTQWQARPHRQQRHFACGELGLCQQTAFEEGSHALRQTHTAQHSALARGTARTRHWEGTSSWSTQPPPCDAQAPHRDAARSALAEASAA
jgi:hypothetical protein